MKVHRLVVSALLLATTAVVGSTAKNSPGIPATNEVNAAAAFSRLKSLAGDWDVDSSRGKGRSKFEVIAAGSVVLEHFIEPGGQEMLTAYHLDGSQLVLTHYCEAGNQPHMVAQKFDDASGQLDFAFAGATNLAPGTGHMHDASFHLISSDRFDASWNFVEAGKTKFNIDIHYIRAK